MTGSDARSIRQEDQPEFVQILYLCFALLTLIGAVFTLVFAILAWRQGRRGAMGTREKIGEKIRKRIKERIGEKFGEKGERRRIVKE